MRRMLTAVLAMLAALAGVAHASYPERLVRIVVPYDPGTGADILARTLGQRLAEKWKTPVIVENRPGASTAIGTEHVQKSAPDGYTLMVTANTPVINKSLRPQAPYDPVNGLDAVLPLAIGRLTLVAHPTLGVKTAKELVAAARKTPGAINYGSPGNGTPHHLAMELFKQATHANLTHVPFSTTGGALQALLGGHVKVMFFPIHVALPHVRENRLVLLASGGLERSDVTPDVPSLSEAVDIKLDGDIWYGMYAPRGTPAAIVRKLNEDVNEILRIDAVREVFSRQGLTATGGSSDEFARLTREDLDRWTQVVRRAGIQVD